MKLIFRKAKQADACQIANLVTKLLGTCDVRKLRGLGKTASVRTIYNRNKRQISKDIQNYFVCLDGCKIVGACGISAPIEDCPYDLENIKKYQEILYLVVDNSYQRKGIGTSLLQMCCQQQTAPLIYEAWGVEDINSRVPLERCGFSSIKNLGTSYYKDNGYCPLCVNRNSNCNSCCAEVWIKQKD